MKLTNSFCKNAKASKTSRGPAKYSDGGGVYLHVYQNGSKLFYFYYTINGKSKLVAIGKYGIISLSEAREKSRELAKLVASGVDPVKEKRRKKLLEKQDSDQTFENVARRCHENRKGRLNECYANDIIKRLEKDIFPYLGKLHIRDIDPPLLLNVIRKIEARGANDLARRQLKKCQEVFRFARSEGIILSDPSEHLQEALKPTKKGHFTSISKKEIPEFLNALKYNDARLYPSTLLNNNIDSYFFKALN